jgi:hypothetical protein
MEKDQVYQAKGVPETDCHVEFLSKCTRPFDKRELDIRKFCKFTFASMVMLLACLE